MQEKHVLYEQQRMAKGNFAILLTGALLPLE